jgi:hypothetical protein
MRSTVRQIAFLLTLLGTVAAPLVAQAGEKQEARKHYDRGVELFDDGQLEGAMVEFQRSYELTHHFAVLYNIGQVFVSLAKPIEAADAFERYLADGGRKISATRRTEVEKEIVRQKARIATLEIRGLPEGAVVRLDDKEIGKAPIAAPVRVAVGMHTVAGAAEGYDPAETQVTVAGEDQKVVDMVLAKHGEPPPAPPVVVTPAAPPVVAQPVVEPAPVVVSPPVEATVQQSSMSKLRIAGIVSGAVGVAGIGTAIYFYRRAVSLSDKVSNSDAPDSDYRAGKRAETMQWVFYSVGAGALVTGTVLYFLGAPSSSAGQAATGVTPMFGPGLAGLSAQGTF